MIEYPTVEDVVEINKRAIELSKMTKAEKFEIKKPLSLIQNVIDDSKLMSGVKRKAAVLLKGINKAHVFGSANKRTSYMTAHRFLLINAGSVKIHDEKEAKFMMDVREGRKSINDIARWLGG